jgi:3-oxoacyl-[acyl-carrier protein] reductase
MGLKERVALVTGGSGGIGAAICRALAGEGARVAVGYGRSGERAEAVAAEIGGEAFGANMSDPEAPARLVAEVESRLGPVDVLVANHGLGRVASYQEIDATTFDEMLAINTRAPFLLAQAVLPGMCERGFGRVLLMSSLAAFRGGVVGAHYAASKAALHGMGHYLSKDVAASGVTVNVLAPGFVETEMLPGAPEELGKTVPIGRVGQPDEVAELAVAMLSNAYLNNQTVALDGGSYPR